MVAFQGPNVILGLYTCAYSLTAKRELGAAAGEKQGGGPDWPVGLVSAPCAVGMCVLCAEHCTPAWGCDGEQDRPRH